MMGDKTILWNLKSSAKQSKWLSEKSCYRLGNSLPSNTTLKFHHTPVIMAIIKKTAISYQYDHMRWAVQAAYPLLLGFLVGVILVDS